MSSPYVIRPFRESDATSLNDGFNEAFGLGRSLQEWRWKFCESTHGRWILVAEKDGEVVAHYGVLPTTLMVEGRPYLAGQVADVYCLRRTGLTAARVYLKLVREFFGTYGAADKLPLLYGFPGERARKLGQLKLEYGEDRKVQVFSRSGGSRKVWLSGHSVKKGLHLEAFDELWSSSASRYPYGVRRDSHWLKHRFSRPDQEYVHLSCWKGRKMASRAVVVIADDSLHWIDLVWDGESPKAIMKLDEAVGLLAKDQGAQSSELWLGGDPEVEELLLSRGWSTSMHEQLVVVAMSFHPEIASSEVVQNLYYTKADTDLI